MSDDWVIKVEHVSKKFTRSLKRSMAYGLIDTSKSMVGLNIHEEKLREGEFWALQDINFELKKGESLGLIGRNGCGKSTLLRLINGIYPPSTGKISIKGRMGALIAVGAGFHPHMSGRENIYLNGTILGMSQTEISQKIDEIIAFAEIGDFIDAPVSTYSSGMTVRLGFAIAVHADIDILLADEVLSVGDVNFRQKCFTKIAEIKKKGTSIILVSHEAQALITNCQKGLYIKEGVIVYNGGIVDALNRYEAMNVITQQIDGSEQVQYAKNPDVQFEVTNIRFSQPRNEFNQVVCHTGGILDIYFDYESDQELEGVIGGIGLSSSDMAFSSFRTGNFDKSVHVKKEKNTIILSLLSLPYNNLLINLNVALHTQDGIPLFWKTGIPLLIEGDVRHQGVISTSFRLRKERE